MLMSSATGILSISLLRLLKRTGMTLGPGLTVLRNTSMLPWARKTLNDHRPYRKYQCARADC